MSDGVRFLNFHDQELTRLLSSYPVDDIRLDFPVDSRLSADVLGQYEYLPPELTQLCARHGIGIEISLYARDW